jgi:threonyl-tRNA synthetase
MKKLNSGKQFYVMRPSAEIFALSNGIEAEFNPCFSALLKSECFYRSVVDKEKRALVDNQMQKIGFEWDPLSELGHMRQLPPAVVLMETVEKKVWNVVSSFCENNNIPLHRISGGELFNSRQPDINKQLNLIKSNSIYGILQYEVKINKDNLILRYSACSDKLSVAKQANLHCSTLPLGIFEISKSYRHEKTDDLRLGERVRSFRLPELHILSQSFQMSLEFVLSAHKRIVEEIHKLYQSCELMCSVSHEFFMKNWNFLSLLASLTQKPILIVKYDDGAVCGNGIQLDIEYKVMDYSGVPTEIATVQVDEGNTDFAFNVEAKHEDGKFKPVSTVHAVFFASVERASYCLIDRAVANKTSNEFYPLPFWAIPVQARIITKNKAMNNCAIKLAKKLTSLNIRVDIDDRDILISQKLSSPETDYVPYAQL